MIVNNKEVSVDEAVKFANFDELLLKRQENGFLLSDYQIYVLKRNGINFSSFNNIRDLLFEIESCLDNDFDEDLDLVGSQISEYIYYSDTKK